MKWLVVCGVISVLALLPVSCPQPAETAATPETTAWPPHLMGIDRIEQRQSHPCCIDPVVLVASNAAERKAIDDAVAALAAATPLVPESAPVFMPFVSIEFISSGRRLLELSPAMNCKREASTLSCVGAPGDFWLVERGGARYRFPSEALQTWYDAFGSTTGHREPWGTSTPSHP